MWLNIFLYYLYVNMLYIGICVFDRHVCIISAILGQYYIEI